MQPIYDLTCSSFVLSSEDDEFQYSRASSDDEEDEETQERTLGKLCNFLYTVGK